MIEKKITALAGNQFEVKLPSNPSVGHGWKFLASEHTLVRVLSSEIVTSIDGRQGEGEEVFKFQALNEGSLVLEFEYRGATLEPEESNPRAAIQVDVIDPVKQVIVMRRLYPDGKGGNRKVRTGKMCAQAAHASMAFLTNKLREGSAADMTRSATFSVEEIGWIEYRFAKVVLYVDSEEELLETHRAALESGLTAYLIQDAGDTEFGGIPTYTALGIGPHKSSILKPVTGALKLF